MQKKSNNVMTNRML